MKKFFCLCLLAGFLTLPLSVQAAKKGGEELNMGTLTCGELLKMEEEEIALLYFWLDGYMSKATNNLKINEKEAEANITTLAEECEKAPKKKVMSLIRE
ncbi:MAG: HdeA family protein [Desulfovibrio sp.]|jgi:hypothetical protein|nr:HdeA family protein [Desulfovibrio sp.]